LFGWNSGCRMLRLIGLRRCSRLSVGVFMGPMACSRLGTKKLSELGGYWSCFPSWSVISPCLQPPLYSGRPPTPHPTVAFYRHDFPNSPKRAHKRSRGPYALRVCLILTGFFFGTSPSASHQRDFHEAAACLRHNLPAQSVRPPHRSVTTVKSTFVSFFPLA